MSESRSDKTTYGYVLYPGNNPAVIQNALKKRNVWTSLNADKELLSACFVWKQLNLASNIYADFQDVLKCYPSRHLLLNHFEYNHVITTKSGILKTLKYYYNHEQVLTGRSIHIHQVIPTSFHIKAHKKDTQYKDFVDKFNQIERKNFHKEKVPEKHCEKNVWFIKPESDNQGKGIILSNNFKQIESFLISKPVNSGWIVQKAIQRPLLYGGRKFDVRVWVLVTPHLEIYYYNTPYMRTSSSIYTTDSMNSQIHLTNNCKQKTFGEYSKFEEGNTLPLKQTLLSYLQTLPEAEGRGQTILDETISRMKQMIIDTMMSARKFFGRSGKKKEFELFGYDFLMDEDFRVWLLEINNNPYLGTPNAFIKDLLPKMVNEMMEIILDPIFPPVNYEPVEEKRFQLIHKETSLFRLQPIRMVSTSTEAKILPKRQTSFSKYKVSQMQRSGKSDLYNVGKQEKSLKPIYSTPAESLRYLLDNYCFNDLDPFMIPTTLLLSSPSLFDEQCLESNLKKIKLISETRIARILLEPKIFELAVNIISQDKYSQKIKAAVLNGFVNACKTFKGKIFIMKNMMPLLCEAIRGSGVTIEETFIEAIVRLSIACGAYFDRSVFIPGESRQNEFVRQAFIRSNTMKLLLYLKKRYPHVCSHEITTFTENLSESDWELYYQESGNKKKRCYSPKMNTAPDHEGDSIIINASFLAEEKPKVLNTATEKKFRMRRHSGINPK